MNGLSWALYAAGTLDSLKIFLVLVGLALGPAYLIVTAIQHTDGFSFGEPWPWPKAYAFGGLLMLFVSCAVPSAKTVYMIAASEAGERVASSAEGREMLDLVRRRIRELLSDKA